MLLRLPERVRLTHALLARGKAKADRHICLGSFRFIICVFDCARSGKAQAAFDFGISGLSMLCCVARSGQLTPAGFRPNASVQLRCATAMTSAWTWHAKDRKAREE